MSGRALCLDFRWQACDAVQGKAPKLLAFWMLFPVCGQVLTGWPGRPVPCGLPVRGEPCGRRTTEFIAAVGICRKTRWAYPSVSSPHRGRQFAACLHSPAAKIFLALVRRTGESVRGHGAHQLGAIVRHGHIGEHFFTLTAGREHEAMLSEGVELSTVTHGRLWREPTRSAG